MCVWERERERERRGEERAEKLTLEITPKDWSQIMAGFFSRFILQFI
jgi:hypothetical protein